MIRERIRIKDVRQLDAAFHLSETKVTKVDASGLPDVSSRITTGCRLQMASLPGTCTER